LGLFKKGKIVTKHKIATKDKISTLLLFRGKPFAHSNSLWPRIEKAWGNLII
jgi:hypothetical protein